MVEFNWRVKLFLFLSSYVPLFLILAVELISRPPLLLRNITHPLLPFSITLSAISTLLFVLSVSLSGFLWFLLTFHAGHKTEDKRCDHYRQRNELLSSYLLVYVFVFVGLNFTVLSDWIIFLIFFGMLAVLQLRSEMLHINPLLGFAGYRIYEVESDTQTLLVLTRTNIRESIKIPESQRDVKEPEYMNLELIQLGPSTYMTSTEND